MTKPMSLLGALLSNHGITPSGNPAQDLTNLAAALGLNDNPDDPHTQALRHTLSLDHPGELTNHTTKETHK